MAAWVAVIAAALALAVPEPLQPLYSEARSPPTALPGPGLPDLSRLAEGAVPAVVGVITTTTPPAGARDEALRELFDRLHDGARRGIGSGFVIHRDGWVVTNAHVVEGAATVEVDLGSNQKLPARVVGADAESDIALLKVAADRPLAFIPLGDSDRVLVAEWVLVIGSPFGLDHSVTLGIVSHTGRGDISPVGRPGSYDFIQTDASINPGNSGGPMLNLRGEVVGIATAVNATGQGIGFAIPINMAKEIIAQLQRNGRVIRSWLGVAVREASVPGAPAAVVITEVVEGGPAAAAGLRVGDVITGFEGHSVRSPGRLRWYVSTAGVGRSVEVRLRRGAEPEQAIRVSLGAVPPSEEARAQARAVVGDD